jgi:hypothetical protein
MTVSPWYWASGARHRSVDGVAAEREHFDARGGGDRVVGADQTPSAAACRARRDQPVGERTLALYAPAGPEGI